MNENIDKNFRAPTGSVNIQADKTWGTTDDAVRSAFLYLVVQALLKSGHITAADKLRGESGFLLYRQSDGELIRISIDFRNEFYAEFYGFRDADGVHESAFGLPRCTPQHLAYRIAELIDRAD